VGDVGGPTGSGPEVPRGCRGVSRWSQGGSGGDLPTALSLGVLDGVFDWLNDLREGRLRLLRGRFLLVVTPDRVYAFRFKDVGGGLRIEIEDEIASFDRDDVRLRSYAGGELFHLSATERGRVREIELDGAVVTEASGASEVIAALSE
jgi:hypothetical protein